VHDGENDSADAMLECAAAGGDRGNAEGQRESWHNGVGLTARVRNGA